jgi:hypothetical protein
MNPRPAPSSWLPMNIRPFHMHMGGFGMPVTARAYDLTVDDKYVRVFQVMWQAHAL